MLFTIWILGTRIFITSFKLKRSMYRRRQIHVAERDLEKKIVPQLPQLSVTGSGYFFNVLKKASFNPGEHSPQSYTTFNKDLINIIFPFNSWSPN